MLTASTLRPLSDLMSMMHITVSYRIELPTFLLVSVFVAICNTTKLPCHNPVFSRNIRNTKWNLCVVHIKIIKNINDDSFNWHETLEISKGKRKNTNEKTMTVMMKCQAVSGLTKGNVFAVSTSSTNTVLP